MADQQDASPEAEVPADDDLDEFERCLTELMPGKPGEMFHAPLGEFLLAFNEFEIRLSFALQQLSRAHPSESGVLPLEYVKTVFDRVKLLRQMATRRFPKTKISDDAKRIFDAMKSSNSFRNALVHGQWKSRGGSASGSRNEHGRWDIIISREANIVYFDSSGEGEWQIHHPTPDSISQKTNQLKSLTIALFNLIGDIHQEQRSVRK